MSCFMLGERSLTVIAKYLAAAANAKGPGTMLVGIAKVSTRDGMDKVLRDAGCYDAKHGVFDEKAVYELVAGMNATAVRVRYDRETEYGGFVRGITIDTGEQNRRNWLARLYHVCCCYAYNIAEGVVCDTPFYKEFNAWVGQLAASLADYLVDEACGPAANRSIPWGEF